MANAKKGWTFAQVPIWLLCDPRISDGAARLFGYLVWRQGEHPDTWPSISTMAVDLGVSEDTIRRRIRELDEAAYTNITYRSGRSSHYAMDANPEDASEQYTPRIRARGQKNTSQENVAPPAEMLPHPPHECYPTPSIDATHNDSKELDFKNNTVDANAPTPILSEDEAGAREFEELFGTGAPTALECVVIAPFTARDLQTEEGRERAQAHLLRSRRLTVENEPWQIWGHCPTLSEYSPPVEISRTFVLQAISLLMQAGVPLDLQKKSEVRFWISSVESIGRKCGWEIGVVEQALARALQAGLSIKGPQSIDYAIADIMVKAQQAQNGGVIAGGDGGMITAIRKVTD